MGREDENLISIDEVIRRARDLGVSFRNGDPRNRLRYYVKIGLLPNAKRKSFNNNSPEGAYPENVVGLLFEIDRKIKTGKSIQIIKREIKEEKEKKERKKENLEARLFETPFTPSLRIHIYTPPPSPSEIKEEFQPEKKLKPSFKLSVFLKPVFIVLIFGLIVFFMNAKINFRDSISYFLANLSSEVRKLVQAPSPSPREEMEEIFSLPTIEPYLTINAETAINSSLNVKESVSSPAFIITKGNFKGFLTLTALTTDRTYTFPNQSGLVCLSTGNCVGLGGEVLTSDGIPNRLAKFISPRRIDNSSINDLYSGISITIAPTGNIGIGRENPAYALHVQGRIQATGDICTDLMGGKCLSELAERPTIFYGGGGGGGIGGSGSTNYLPIWTGATTLGNSIISQSGTILNVAGTINMLGFQLPTNATSGYILTSDAAGFGTWQPAPSGVIPSGTAGQTLRHNGLNWLADSFLYNSGSAIGIGTTSTLATLTIAGDGLFQGPLTIATTTFPQFILKYDDDNYLRFSINATSTEILSSKTMIINSLTGEIKLAGGVNLFDASLATIKGATFISAANDSTVRKSGEKVFRASIPIFIYPIPAQTTSTEFVAVSREISTSTLNATLPDILPGATRKFAFLINFADNIPTSASSTWLIDLTTGTDPEFFFTGQNPSTLEEGVPHLSDSILPPEKNWQLKVKVPSGNVIRIFSIFLLTYDQII